MLSIDIQRSNEFAYCRKHHDKYIVTALKTPALKEKVNEGTQLIKEWMSSEFHPTKQARIDQLKELDVTELVEKAFSQIAYYVAPTTFVSVVAQVAGHLGFNDRKEAIQTTAEILAVLCNTNAFDITKESKQASLMLVSKLVLPAELTEAIERGTYPLPMVVEPQNLEGNYQSPYLTFNECQILGKSNGHEGELSLDVLNAQNQIPLTMDVAFLSSVEEGTSAELDTQEKVQMWYAFKKRGYEVYRSIVQQGNTFYLTHKVDKRGRIYSQGYHINTQGTPFKKACIELKNKEVIQGVPRGI